MQSIFVVELMSTLVQHLLTIFDIHVKYCTDVSQLCGIIPKGHDIMTFERNREADLFVVLAYETLRADNPKGGKYEKIHTVWNGFNQLFRKLFPGIDPVSYTKGLAEEGMIQLSAATGGAFLKPCKHFQIEAQTGQEELGLKVLKFLEDYAAAQKPVAKTWQPGDMVKRLEELGY
jgi:hypothetical protein